MKAHWTKKTLHFKQPAGTSRGVMKDRDVWYITLSQDGKTGIGECAPLPGLSSDDFDQIESKLDEVCQSPGLFINDLSQLADFPSLRFGLEMAHLDLINGGGQHCFGEFDSININGLIWMGDEDFMVRQVEEKLADGWQCIKMKFGAIGFAKELSILRSIRKRFSREELELRVDANGAFTKDDVHKKLDQLAPFDLHSIEQPIQQGQWELLFELCQSSPVPIALDEELITLVREKERIEMLDKVKPQYLVLKPSLLGGFSESEKWIQLAKERNIGWWVTSALESSIGLHAISQWTSKLNPDGFQGLGTGQLFVNNLPSPLKVNQGVLSSNKSPIWNDVNQFITECLNGDEEMTLQTSGTTGKPKSIQVKKDWMKNSAQLTGKTFGLNEGDSALLCMPMKYVAGKMMVVRALELGVDLKVVEPSSSPLKGIDEPIDFTAMVPRQLENSLQNLDKVKTLIVGGGQVHSALVEKLQSIKTEVFETYGMTETLTHVAIKPLNGSEKTDVFQALGGIQFGTDDRECLVIHAPMLNHEPVITNDLVEMIDKSSFRWLGRLDNVVNSGGIKIIPEVVEAKLVDVIPDRRFFIAGAPDESFGQKVVLVVEGSEIEFSLDSLEKYEKPKEIYFVSEFVETDSGKVRRKDTFSLI
ncbi:MAG: o-succinylbenzoate synthase [Candidatus Marinimicrobia bacterium]|jgi:o-succinylbenzoate synthase|nr:o-succinylbenzoate synthase [Candidatus Neomarinimicrobiota bacterium]